MFPAITVSVANLDPTAEYTISMDIVPVTDTRYRFKNSEWVDLGEAKPSSDRSSYIHPVSPASGSLWEKIPTISFNKVKVTNTEHHQPGYVRNVCCWLCVFSGLGSRPSPLRHF